MKILHLIRPISVTKQRELELQLEDEKRRFAQATREAASAMRYDLSPRNILAEYPVETALVILVGGIFLGTFWESKHTSLTRHPGLEKFKGE